MNHTIHVKLGRKNHTSHWRLDTLIRTALVRVNTSSQFGNFTYKLVNLTVDVPTVSKDVNATYQFGDDKKHKLIVMMNDREDSRFICIGKVERNGTVHWNCSKKQVQNCKLK